MGPGGKGLTASVHHHQAALEQDLSLLECDSQGPRGTDPHHGPGILTAILCLALNLAPRATRRTRQ